MSGWLRIQAGMKRHPHDYDFVRTVHLSREQTVLLYPYV